MYTEERKGSLLQQFLVKLILIIIFILLLIWLVPWPNMDSYIEAINPLKDKIFNENIQTMKDAAITYYTTERLPQNVGDVKKISLQEMFDMKLLIPFTDRNGNSCDVKKSYVSLEKKDTEYLMKVNLKCGDEENYILVHLGCYSYCSTDICEAKKDATPVYKCKYVGGKYYDNKGKEVDKSTYIKACTPPTVTPKTNPTCALVNGIYYDKKGNVVSFDAYRNSCLPKPAPEKHTCEVFAGEYYDQNGNKVDKVTYYQRCNDVVCKIYEGIYFGKDGKQTTELGYQEQCVKHVCVQFNNKWYDKNGNVTSYENYLNSCDKLKYEYKKYTPGVAASCASWSNWTVKILSSGSLPGSIDNKYKVEDLGTKKVQIGILPKVPAQYEYKTVINEVLTQTGTQEYKVCNNVEYEVVGGQLYQISGGWSSTGITKSSSGSPASDSANTRWRAVGLDYDTCGSSCANNPYITWEQQSRNASAVTTTIQVTPVCTSVEIRQVPVYTATYNADTQKLLVKPEIPETPIYGNKHFYREKTCTNFVPEVAASTVYAWSKNASDANLISQGYVLTGRVMEG